MHHSTQKQKLTEYLDGIYEILKKKKYIKTTPYTFKTDWYNNSYENRISGVCIDILYAILMQNQNRLNGLRDAIRIDYAGDIEGFLNGNGFVQGNVKKPKKGVARLGWEFLEKLRENDMKYFDNLFIILQEKNQEKNQENT